MFDIGLVVSIQAIYPDNPSLNPAVINFLLLFCKLLSEKVRIRWVEARVGLYSKSDFYEQKHKWERFGRVWAIVKW